MFDRPLQASEADPSDWRCFRCEREKEFRDVARRQIDAPRKAQLRDNEAKRKDRALAIWDDAQPISPGDPVDLYLRGRQLEPPGGAKEWPSCLRLAKLWHPADRQTHPVMVALVVDVAGMPSAIHRTYVTHDGQKASVRPVKMMLGATAGAAVRLGHGPRVIVAEGIESALAAAAIHRELAPWAALSAGGLEALRIPRDVTRIVCARDRGKAGRKAATVLRQRVLAAELEQRRIIHFAVAHPGGDDDFAQR